VTSLETILFRSAVAALVLHAFDEAVVSPPAGTALGDHWSVLALALLGIGVAVVYPRLPVVARALLAFVFLPLAVAGAAMHVMDARWNGAHGADFTGFLLIPAAGAFVAAAVLAVLSRPRPRSWPRRIGRWALTAVAIILLGLFVSLPIGVGVAQSRKPGRAIPESAFSTPHRTVALHTRDGPELAGWYVPSRNRAAIVVVHGGGGDRLGA